jgi:cellulose synthase/poly-beta-1,6-N-acetylglucosamine synthase-like glycosyltransferase
MPSSQYDQVEANLDSPRVTICVPVRNGSRTIRRTLDSTLAQDYPNLEVIVSDNCSTDDTTLCAPRRDSRQDKIARVAQKL